jgi:hypothetical protein
LLVYIVHKAIFKQKISVNILAVLLLVSLISPSALAAPNESSNDEGSNEKNLIYSTTISEYQLMKEKKSKSDQELLNMGLDSSTIAAIRKYDFKDESKKRANLSDSELTTLGYSSDKIKALRAIDDNSTEAELMAASSDLSINVYAGSAHGHNSSLSWAVYDVSWFWDARPFWNEQDIVAIGWSEGFYLTPSSQSSYTYANASYYYADTGAFWGKSYFSSDITPD